MKSSFLNGARSGAKLALPEGALRSAAFLVIYFFSSMSGSYLQKLFGAPGSYPGSNPPWYFIRQDFFDGLGSLVGIVLVLLILAIPWNRKRFLGSFALPMSCVAMLPRVVTSAVIWYRCSHFFEYEHSKSYWPTSDSYFSSGVENLGIPIGVGIALILVACNVWRSFRDLKSLRAARG